MKRIKFAALLAAVFSISFAVTGCGGSDGTATPGGPGSPGFAGSVIPGGVSPNATGGINVSFSGASVYDSGIMISAGQASGTYSGNFSNGYAYWSFSNSTLRMNSCTSSMFYPASSTLTVGGGGIPGNLAYDRTSVWEAGARLQIYASAPACALANVAGIFSIPGAFIQRNPIAFPQGASTPILSIAIDAQLNGALQGTGTQTGPGGVIVTTPNGHGAFIAL